MSPRVSLVFWLLVALALLLLVASTWRWRARTAHADRPRRSIPLSWSLAPRATVNREEAEVWRWLSRAFHDHHIMVKLPFTRFTRPNDQAEAEALHRVLRNVYCTFTICRADGRALGCVDVPGRRDVPRKVRDIKHAVLAHCGMSYRIVSSGNLPEVADIRTGFLGESSSTQVEDERALEEQTLAEVQASLRLALVRQRQHRGDSDFGQLSLSDARPSDFNTNLMGSSFLQPLDSRRGDWL